VLVEEVLVEEVLVEEVLVEEVLATLLVDVPLEVDNEAEDDVDKLVDVVAVDVPEDEAVEVILREELVDGVDVMLLLVVVAIEALVLREVDKLPVVDVIDVVLVTGVVEADILVLIEEAEEVDKL
jgi:hypothetical protein